MGREQSIREDEHTSSGFRGDASSRRRSRNLTAARRHRHRRLRMVYFALASFWGFVTGSVAVLTGLAKIDSQSLEVDGELGITLVVAVPIALVGGAIVSLAYREAIRRRS